MRLIVILIAVAGALVGMIPTGQTRERAEEQASAGYGLFV